MVNNGNFTYPTDIQWSRMEISHMLLTSSGQIWHMNLLQPMDPPYKSKDAFNTSTQNLADEPTLADGPPVQEQTCLEYQYTKLGRWTYFGQWTPQGNRTFTLLLTFSGQRMAISHCYWHLVVKNGNFTLLLTSSDQEWQSHNATDVYWSRMAFDIALTSSGQEWKFHIATDI